MNKEQIVENIEGLISSLKEVNTTIDAAKTEIEKEELYTKQHHIVISLEHTLSQLEEIDSALFSEYETKIEGLI